MNKIQSKLLIVAFIIFAFAQVAPAQTSTFTYQGRLTDSSMAANGTYDFQFAVYDAATGGTPQSSPSMLLRPAVTVTNGVFTVQLDFGANPFPGSDRYLEIQVKKSSDASYTTLAPRQPITAAPYAIRSRRAASADTATNAQQLNGVAANKYVQTSDGRLSDARQPAAGSSNYIQNATTQQSGADFNIDGNGTAGGTLSGNAVNSETQFTVGGNGKLRIDSASNILLGTLRRKSNGYEPSVGGGSNSYFGINTGGAFNAPNDGIGFDTTGYNNTLIGNNTSLGFPGLNNATAIGAGARVNSSNTIVLGREQQGLDTVIANGNVTVGGVLQVNLLGNGPGVPLCRNNNTSQLSLCSSSIRYKTNVADFASGLGLINRLRPVTFDWKADGTHDVGFIAEEVNRVEPLLTIYNDKGQVEGVKYDRMSVAFVNAFKEQQTQIEQQQKQITVQQKQIDELKMIVCALKPDAEFCKTEVK